MPMAASSSSYSAVARARASSPVSSVRCAGRCSTKSSSRARWTSEPLVVWGRGGSGSFSMLANRNANGHEVNASTREGDRLTGTGKAMDRSYAGGAMELVYEGRSTDGEDQPHGHEGARAVREADRSGRLRGVLPVDPRPAGGEAAGPPVLRVRQ